MDSLSHNRKWFDNGTLQRRQTISQWHTATDVDDHPFSHCTVSVKAKDFLGTAIVWSTSTATSAARIAATTHWNNANNVAHLQAALAFSVRAKTNNATTCFMPNRARTLDPGEVWFAGTGTIVRTTDTDEHRFDDDFAFSGFRQGDAFDCKISRYRSVWLSRIDVLGAIETQGFNRIRQFMLQPNSFWHLECLLPKNSAPAKLFFTNRLTAQVSKNQAAHSS